MKASEKVEAAKKVAEYAKSIGFEKAYLSFQDEQDDLYDSIEEVAANYNADDVVEITLHVFLDNDITFDLVMAEDADEDAEPEIVYRD